MHKPILYATLLEHSSPKCEFVVRIHHIHYVDISIERSHDCPPRNILDVLIVESMKV